LRILLATVTLLTFVVDMIMCYGFDVWYAGSSIASADL